MAKLARGDLIEIVTDQNPIYLQYIGRHPEYGDVLRLPELQSTDDLVAVAQSPTRQIIFYPATASVSQGLTRVVKQLPLPLDVAVPTSVRRRGRIDDDGRVLTWFIDEGSNTRVTRELTEREMRLPEGGIWNHNYLLIKLGHRPIETDQHQRDGSTGAVAHYLYFERRSDASAARKVLLDHGLLVEQRRSESDDSWLVLVRSERDISEKQIAFIEGVAADHGGSYDGAETDVAG